MHHTNPSQEVAMTTISPAILSTSVVTFDSGRSFEISHFLTRFGEIVWMVFDLQILDHRDLPEWVGVENSAAAAVRRAANLAGL